MWRKPNATKNEMMPRWHEAFVHNHSRAIQETLQKEQRLLIEWRDLVTPSSDLQLHPTCFIQSLTQLSQKHSSLTMTPDTQNSSGRWVTRPFRMGHLRTFSRGSQHGKCSP